MPPVSESAGNSRLRELLDELTTRFVATDLASIDRVIVTTQQALVLKLGLDRSSLWQFNGRRGELILTHLWQKSGWPDVPIGMAARANVPWARQEVENGRAFHFSSISDLPPEADHDRRTFAKYGSLSNVTFPLLANGKVIGALAFASLEKEHSWTAGELAEIRLVAGVFANILGQVRALEHLTELREELRRRSRLSLAGELAATLIHDLSQPLSAIRADAAALRLQGVTGQSGEVAALDAHAVRAAGILSRIRGLLVQSEDSPRAASPGLLVDEVVAMLHPEMHARAVDVQSILPADLPMIRIIEVEIRQVLVNLLLNASEAMDGQTCRRTIRISGLTRRGRVWIIVEDTGPGFPAGLNEKIFEPLFTTRSDGTGMGLAICRRIIAAHGGKIKASRRRGGGARFEFSLPVAKKCGIGQMSVRP